MWFWIEKGKKSAIDIKPNAIYGIYLHMEEQGLSFYRDMIKNVFVKVISLSDDLQHVNYVFLDKNDNPIGDTCSCPVTEWIKFTYLRHPYNFPNSETDFRWKDFNEWYVYYSKSQDADLRGFAYPIVRQAWEASRKLKEKNEEKSL